MQYSIVNIKNIPIESNIFRLDADFFHPSIIETKKTVRAITHSTLRASGAKIIHPIEVKRYYEDSGIQILLAQNIRDNFMNFSETVFMSKNLKNYLSKNKLRSGDVALTRSGANYGQCASYLGEPSEIYACADDLVIRNSKFLNTYLSTYLNTYFGKILIESCKYGGSQPHISPQTLYDIPIYSPSEILVENIDTQIKKSFRLMEKSKTVYMDAQTILLSELGLTDWKPKHQLTFIRHYSDIKKYERMDADYFQPKYEIIENAIKNYSRGHSLIKNEFIQNKSTFEIETRNTYQYVEIGSVSVSNGEITPNFVAGAELPANAKRILNTGDIIISKVRTYRGAITIIEQDGYVGSGAFLILSENGRINKETLLAFLHSNPLLAWSLKPNTGTTYPVIVDDDILNLPIPIFSQTIQTKIQKKITESFALRKQSKHLLECAKRAVEIAIEEDEKTALAWLKKETKE